MKAYALMEGGRTREALFAYKRILDEFPKSRFVPDAHMAFAEWHFSGDYDFAARARRVRPGAAATRESELSDLALFKSAWCLWKLGRKTEAAMRFREVLDLGGELRDQRRAAQAPARAAGRGARVPDPGVHRGRDATARPTCTAFLSEIGGERYASKVLRRLSRAFFDQARFDAGVEAYSMLLESEPDAPQAPEYQRQIAAALLRARRRAGARAGARAARAQLQAGQRLGRSQADPERGDAARR